MSTEDHIEEIERLKRAFLTKIQQFEKQILLLMEAVALLSEEAAGEGLGLPSNRIDLREVQEESLRKFIPDSWLLK